MQPHLTVEQRQLALRLRARGWPLREIGPQVGCSHQGVALVVRRASWRRQAILVVRLVDEGSAAVRFVRRVGSSDCGLAVIRHDTQDRLQVIGRVGAELKSNADMPGRSGDDQHLEVAVPDDEVPQPAAVDVAAPGGEGEQGGVDQQFLVQVAVAAGRVLQIWPRSHL